MANNVNETNLSLRLVQVVLQQATKIYHISNFLTLLAQCYGKRSVIRRELERVAQDSLRW